jgi:hypothetical protein
VIYVVSITLNYAGCNYWLKFRGKQHRARGTIDPSLSIVFMEFKKHGLDYARRVHGERLRFVLKTFSCERLRQEAMISLNRFVSVRISEKNLNTD